MSLQELLDRPIAFQRAFVSLGIGITGALMLSQAVYWSNRTDDVDGWFYKTMEEWESETGMTRSEQESARKKLVKCGVLQEMKKGVPCRLYYRVQLEVIAATLDAGSPQTSKRKPRKPVCRIPANKAAGNQQAGLRDSCEQASGNPANITENTTEITAETSSEITAEILQDASAAPPQPANLVMVAGRGPRCPIPADMPGPKDQSCKTFKAWANYAMAYRKRYQAWPVWNAKVGGQLGQLIDRLGIDVAHHVAAYFVGINDSGLIRGCHGIGDLLVKAEAYHTQWATNRQMNNRTARQIEDTQANISAAEQAIEALRAKRASGDAE
ncbi:helix-turn-helix domain-containing protein [Pseudomonas capsici]|uniref:helix-turn-helix domain-containing protein n=1 Tax=Pseudomonas capsici TaxID=2810614 RepID=UPI0021F23FC5|nr:helix-turn-helix domain-containing protein [Pseudomonas capsici]MCV4285069.1 helix-turn-helix domain-containing protein [Pseudomonas capsici]